MSPWQCHTFGTFFPRLPTLKATLSFSSYKSERLFLPFATVPSWNTKYGGKTSLFGLRFFDGVNNSIHQMSHVLCPVKNIGRGTFPNKSIWLSRRLWKVVQRNGIQARLTNGPHSFDSWHATNVTSRRTKQKYWLIIDLGKIEPDMLKQSPYSAYSWFCLRF